MRLRNKLIALSILGASLFSTNAVIANSDKVIAREVEKIAEICFSTEEVPIFTEVLFSEVGLDKILTKEEAKIKRDLEEQRKLEAKRKEEEQKALELKKQEEEKQRLEEEKKLKEESIKENSETDTNLNKPSSVSSEKLFTIDEFEFMGIVNWNGNKFSYYSERVLPGPALQIPGRHTSDGFVRDEEGYIVAAIAGPKGLIFATPFGAPAKVYDYCVGCEPHQVDLYTR